MSLKASSVYGGEELFIIGKNFLRGTKVFFQELSEDENAAVQWEKESEIDRDYFQPVSDVDISKTLNISLFAFSFFSQMKRLLPGLEFTKRLSN